MVQQPGKRTMPLHKRMAFGQSQITEKCILWTTACSFMYMTTIELEPHNGNSCFFTSESFYKLCPPPVWNFFESLTNFPLSSASNSDFLCVTSLANAVSASGNWP